MFVFMPISYFTKIDFLFFIDKAVIKLVAKPAAAADDDDKVTKNSEVKKKKGSTVWMSILASQLKRSNNVT